MLKKFKYLITLLFFILLLLITPSVVNATDTFTTDDGIQVKNAVTEFSNGDIKLEISNITLNSEGNYTWGLGTSSSADDIKKWHVLVSTNATDKTEAINLKVEDRDIYDVLRKTNTAYLFIKNNDDDSFIINGLEIDVTLPPLYAFEIGDCWKGKAIGSVLYGATYNIGTVYHKFEKITDETIINTYKQAVSDGTSLADIFTITASDVEKVKDWMPCTQIYGANNVIENTKIPTEQGVYYLWIKAKDVDSKTVYGCLIVNVDGDGPTVSSLSVSSPKSGTYLTGQTVKIRAHFSEVITGSTVPTLKIKFGDGAVRTISNGTLVNTSNDGSHGHYIEYSYDIQDGDVGQLATVSYEGGNIKDSSENDAVLSCPVITGNTITANKEGTTTNTDNKDKNNNQTTKPSGNNSSNGGTSGNGASNNGTSNGGTSGNGASNNDSSNGSTSGNGTSNNNPSGSNSLKGNPSKGKPTKDDPSASDKNLPQAGTRTGIILVIIILVGSPVFAYFKHKKLRGV